MPDTPLSQLPGFIPAATPGTPAFKAFVATVFSNPSANAAFHRCIADLAQPASYSTLSAAFASEKGAEIAR